MPGISPLRSRPSLGADGLAFGVALALAFGPPPRRPAPRPARRGALAGVASGRSIFGARLRSRVPQYGHSVTYGLTSAWQFLHTTKRSGWDMAFDSTEPADARVGAVYSRGGRDDLRHDLVEVVVRLVDDDLARGAVAALEQVADAVEGVRRAEILRVRGQAIEQPAGQRLRADALVRGQVDDLALEAVARREPLVLVEHLPRVVRQRLALVVVLARARCTIAWMSAVSATVCSTRVCESQQRISTVPRFGCGRTSYQRYV